MKKSDYEKLRMSMWYQKILRKT